MIKIYRNKQNPYKFLEVHNDGHYHNSVRQYIKTQNLHTPQYTGDGNLHRWKSENLKVLLDDYEFVKEM